MKVLHLAAGNRWTGAAAPAFAEVEALRAAGIDAHYAYVGGYKLEAKLGHLDFAHPIIERAQNPLSFRRTVAAIERMIHQHGFDVVHAHLTWDHWLARFAVGGHRVRLARTFHARRVLRSDPFTQSLLGVTRHLFVVNDSFRRAAALRGRESLFTPPPVDHRQFHPDGSNVRAQYGLDERVKLVTVIGKLSSGRGFEAALDTYRELRPLIPESRLMIIGHGEHRPLLENHALRNGVADGVIWAGYHEDDLAEHYRAADLLLFTARGSDEGHRAILEAMACGVPPATYPIEGVEALVDSSHVAAGPEPEALARCAAALLRRDRAALRAGVAARSHDFGYAHAARRLIEAYAV